MIKEVSKKVSIALLLLAIVLSVWVTLNVLSYSPIIKNTAAKGSESAGEITLTIEKPVENEADDNTPSQR